MVRQAIAGALPPPHRYPARAKPKLGAIAAFIDQVLDEDWRAPRKQRHTARRIYRRILTEFPDAAVAESTVRNHVRDRRRVLGLNQRETFVPQSYVLGHEAQADWYEAWRSWPRFRRRSRWNASGGRSGWRADPHAGFCDVVDGERCGVPPGLPARDAAGVPWRHTSMRSPISAGCSGCCATTTWPARAARSCGAIGGRRR